jgi:hypothetical protein
MARPARSAVALRPRVRDEGLASPDARRAATGSSSSIEPRAEAPGSSSGSLSGDGRRLFVANTARGTLDILTISDTGHEREAEVTVGIDPVIVAVRTPGEVCLYEPYREAHETRATLARVILMMSI